MPPKSSPQPKYLHLLYLSEADRQAYRLDMEHAPSSPSLRSVRSHGSFLSASSRSTSGTSQASSHATLRFVDDHYPLITTVHQNTVPASGHKGHSASWCARQMAQIHNTIIRALNASWNHAVLVQPCTQEASDFLHFNQRLMRTLNQHHHVEDNYLFPEIEKLLGRPGAMEENMKGHESFAEGLTLFEKYLSVTKPSEFCGLTFRHIIESFAPSLIQHLHDEITSLANLDVPEPNALKKIWRHAERLAIKDANLYRDLPWYLGCQDRTFTIDGIRGDFPAGPWILEALIRNWHSRKHAGAWRFCPSDLSGRRRQLLVV
ncbi:hypothetical protein A1O1_07854 [Capronia coronata CBS 617.96]|uniref:Hemerythrin-like domain-containing protein n=1 Tax=Capronia coronata CBS 617.96 TaxID=1182541 RepID=W9YHN0_9EURO|nr:uncharacterized protein A1O1_07854 [Capronia coronata CBS 617.96]EXJ81789.1 hypothetical protein A1O1_07854 [Capronia coronata CBS 617.96]